MSLYTSLFFAGRAGADIDRAPTADLRRCRRIVSLSHQTRAFCSAAYSSMPIAAHAPIHRAGLRSLNWLVQGAIFDARQGDVIVTLPRYARPCGTL